jgi:hypothetical protein
MTKSTIALLLIVVICSIISPLYAELYIWTDKNGVKHYSNTLPPQEATNIKEAVEQSTNVNETGVIKKESNQTENRIEKKVDNSVNCKKKLQQCKDHRNNIYESKAKSCEGDWTAASTLNKMTGKTISAKELLEACKKEFKDERDKSIKECERSYNQCIQ